ncbi:hypothetical protein ZWY2020_014400 [Hordeum vulgare]|nr:hypothetical protein ZWY2020_014400 [Hordeum vulgare]
MPKAPQGLISALPGTRPLVSLPPLHRPYLLLLALGLLLLAPLLSPPLLTSSSLNSIVPAARAAGVPLCLPSWSSSPTFVVFLI